MAVRIGFIGTGGIANHHLSLLPRVERAQLVAFSDVVEDKAKAAAARFNGRAYTDYRQMLDQEDLQAVYVCLPPFAHGDPEYAVIEHGLHLFVEKPLSTKLSVAQDISEAVNKAGIIACVGHNWRHMDITDRTIELMAGKRPALGIGYWIGGTPGVPWWRVKAQSGGQTVEQTIHVFDIARYLMGEVTSVYAVASRGLVDDMPNYDVEDASAVTLTFESGAVATIFSSCVADQGYGAEMHVITRGMTLKLGTGNLTVEEPGKTTQYRPRNNPYQYESELFLEAVETGDTSKIRAPYDDCLKSLVVALAADESLETGKAVHL